MYGTIDNNNSRFTISSDYEDKEAAEAMPRHSEYPIL